MMLRFLLVVIVYLFLYGCARGPTVGDQALMCKPVDSAECIELQNKYENWRKARENKSSTPCPPGYALLITHMEARCVLEREMTRKLKRTFE